MRHESPDAVLDKILVERIQENARELAARMNEWLGAPASVWTPMDATSSDVAEWCRGARDILQLVGGAGG